MLDLTVTNNRGESLALSGNNDYVLYKVEGLQPPNVTLALSSNAVSDGYSFNSAKVESRNIVIYVALENDIENSRLTLYKYFPLKKQIRLHLKNGRRDVIIDGYVDIIECDLFSKREVMQVSIICSKPYFKAVDELISVFGDITAQFEFPFSIDSDGIEFSALEANQRKLIVNSGDVDTGCIIELFALGEVVNPVIYSVIQSQKMEINLTMQSGDRLTINTNIGEKSIYLEHNGVMSNALGYLSADSDWLMLLAGDNVFTYSAEDGQSNMQITFRTSVLYGGV